MTKEVRRKILNMYSLRRKRVPIALMLQAKFVKEINMIKVMR